jgi:predicted HTH transcriptional regulator
VKQGELFPRYPNVPGFKRRDTSQDAAAQMQHESSQLQTACLSVIVDAPSTADEVAETLRRSILTIRPRLSELVAKNKIEDSGVRRHNLSGKRAIVWQAK